MDPIFEYKPAFYGYVHNYRHDLASDESHIKSPEQYFEAYGTYVKNLIRSHVGPRKNVTMFLTMYIDMEKLDGTENTYNCTPKKRLATG